jgi:hypothetical protein
MATRIHSVRLDGLHRLYVYSLNKKPHPASTAQGDGGWPVGQIILLFWPRTKHKNPLSRIAGAIAEPRVTRSRISASAGSDPGGPQQRTQGISRLSYPPLPPTRSLGGLTFHITILPAFCNLPGHILGLALAELLSRPHHGLEAGHHFFPLPGLETAVRIHPEALGRDLFPHGPQESDHLLLLGY